MSHYRLSERIRQQADFVAFLCFEPRTVPELVSLVGAHRSTVRAWLDAFEERGLAKPVGHRKEGKKVLTVWGWAQ